MRIDLFLKASRLVKRRTRAREFCEGGSIFLNGRRARPAKEVKPGDRITLLFSSRHIELEVLALSGPSGKGKKTGTELFRITAERRIAGEDDRTDG